MLNWKQRLLKNVDKLAGPWLCGHVRPLARRLEPDTGEGEELRKANPVPATEVNRILVIRPGGLGDAALTFPMLKTLYEFFHCAKIDMLAEARNADVYRMSRLISKIHLYDQEPLTTVRQLRRIGYDAVIDTEQFHHLSSLVANVLKPTYFCGFATLSRMRLQTHPVPYSDRTYEVLSFLSMAEAIIGSPVQFDPDEPFIDVPEEAKESASNTLTFLGHRDLAIVMPSAMSHLRFWPAERYGKVVRWLVDHGFYVVIIGGPDAVKASKIMANELARNRVLNLAGKTTISQAVALIQRARVYVGADTGLLHLAYGVGTPTVSLFGPGNHEKWAPPGTKHVMVRKTLSCSPCNKFGNTPDCPRRVICMDTIEVDDVTSAIAKVLEL